MSFLHAATPHLAHAAASGLVAGIWQGTVLSIIVALALRLLPRTPAAIRFAIWFTVFVVVAALPFLSLIHTSSSAGTHAAWLTLDESWPLILAAAWAAASLARAFTLLLAIARVRTLWKHAVPLTPHLADAIARLRPQRHTRRAQLCLSHQVDRPTVIGFFSPRILLPATLVETLSTTELHQIVLHELGHLTRADDWMNLLQKLALVVFPLNPALAWIERRLCFERELACDDHVLQTTGAPKAYASCLASIAEHRLRTRGLTLALGVLGRESELALRIRRILSRRRWMRPLQYRLVLGATMLGLLAATAGFEHCPQLIGFASTPYDAAAATISSQPPAISTMYTYQQVVFHPATPQATQPKLVRRNKAHRPAAATVGKPSPLNLAEQTAPNLPTQPGIYPVRQGINPTTLQEIQTQAQLQRLLLWAVMTSWRSSNPAAEVVFTTLRAPISSPTQQPDAEEAAPQTAAPTQVHPYAAVPVNDGWLIFQL